MNAPTPPPGGQDRPATDTDTSTRRGGQYRPHRSTGYRAHSHYTPDELELRARNAWYWTQLEPEGFNTKSELVVAGMTLICEMLEDLYNDGQPFLPAPDDIRRGPSPAGAARQSAAMRAWWTARSNGAGTEPVPGNRAIPVDAAANEQLSIDLAAHDDPVTHDAGRGANIDHA